MLRAADIACVETLTQKLRFLSVEQAAGMWWLGRRHSTVRRRLLALADEGWLSRLTTVVPPALTLAYPLCSWSPGDEAPDFDALAYAAQNRAPRARTSVDLFAATPAAARRFGGRAGAFKLGHLFHDLNVAALYARLVAHDPAYAQAWVGEDRLLAERAGDVCPDAELRTPDGTPYRVLEFAGTSYKAERFARLLDDCAFRRLPMEIF